MKFFSVGGNATRMEKTAYIANYPPTYKYLNVCVEKSQNDGICFKCVRTLLTLDALNVLERYSQVFDIEHYNSNRKQYLRDLYLGATFKHNSFFKELFPYFEKEINLAFKLSVLASVVKNRVIGLFK